VDVSEVCADAEVWLNYQGRDMVYVKVVGFVGAGRPLVDVDVIDIVYVNAGLRS
jgi:hypothetical protein